MQGLVFANDNNPSRITLNHVKTDLSQSFSKKKSNDPNGSFISSPSPSLSPNYFSSSREAQSQSQSLAQPPTQITSSVSNPSGSSGPSSSSVDLKSLGNNYFREGKLTEALRSFTLALNADKENPILYSNRSAVHHALNDFENALKDAEAVIQRRPNWSKGYFRKGQALAGLMRLEEAAEAFKQSHLLDPNEPLLLKAIQEITIQLEEVALSKNEINSSVVNPDDDKYKRLIEWLLEGGAQFPFLCLKYYDIDYRGVHTLTRVPANQVVLEIPQTHIMTSELAKNSHIGKLILQSKIELASTHSFLAALLLQEKYNPNSFWEPYISSLPQQYKNMPIFFQEEELQYLRGSFTLGKIIDRQEELRDEYENICRAVPEFSKFSHQDFVWARLVVITRIFGLVINGSKTDGLVPMADMLNHRRPRETSWTFDDSRQAFTITTLKAIQRGEQIHDSYGRKCNSRFFVNYGFALEDNREDNQVILTIDFPSSDPHLSMKLDMIGCSSIASARKKFQIPCDYNEASTKECFSYLRFIHAQEKEFLVLSNSQSFNIKKIEPLSIRNELDVLNHLNFAAKEVLSGFPTSLSADLVSLGSNKLSSNIRNCLLMIKGEKEVLHFYMELYNEVQPLCNLPWRDFKKTVAKYYTVKQQIHQTFKDRYITTVIVPLMNSAR